MILETPRLMLRELDLSDVDFIYRLVTDPTYIEGITDLGINNLEQAQVHLKERLMAHYVQHGFGLWLVQQTVSQTPIGLCGLLKREALAEVDLGYAFLGQFQGQGYALEAAQGVFEYAQMHLKLAALMAIVNQDNQRSQALLDKLSFIKQGPIKWRTGEYLDLFLKIT